MAGEADPPVEPGGPKPPPRKRNRGTGGSTSSRFERRAGKIAETIQQATRWTLGSSDAKDLPFVETVERDADKIGHALAAVGEWFDPVGRLIDVVFGLTGPLAVFVGLSPSLQAARRSGQERLAQLRQRRQRQAEEAELAAQAQQMASREPAYAPIEHEWGTDLPDPDGEPLLREDPLTA